MTMSARIVNTSNWEHEDLRVEQEGQEPIVLKPGEMGHLSVEHGPTGQLGKPSAPLRLRSDIRTEPKPFERNGLQIWPRVLAFFGRDEKIK